MNRYITAFLLACWLVPGATSGARAATQYVDINNPAPSAPYTSWSTAATNIQDAVDAAAAGDLVLVSNGVYQTGGRVVFGSMINRVAVSKPVTLLSVNGPGVTTIAGYQVPGTTNGSGSVRCVYLTNGAVLSGFTLTNGATRRFSDSLYEESGGGVWCESSSAVVSNCVVAGNSAHYSGGGVYQGTLNNCILSGNSANHGGGAAYGTVNNCTLSGNLANYGGGAYLGTLNQCALSGNSAYASGGGVSGSTLNNCIVYYNSAPTGANFDSSYNALNYCCTTPLPAGGAGNFTAEPQLVSTSHLKASSPCRGAGSAALAGGTDIDGEAWLNPPSIGCDEYQSGSVTGLLSAALTLSYANVAVGFGVKVAAMTVGPTIGSSWDFGDGTVVSNQAYTSHAWTAPGDYTVLLRAWNDTYPGGVTATAIVHVTQPIHYVSLDSSSPSAPYSSWATAATNIQDAVDAVSLPGALVLVSNGVYQAGARRVPLGHGLVGFGTGTNRVAVTKPVILLSVNGPAVTTIAGYQVPGITNGDAAVRCVYLINGAVLSGFTLTQGATQLGGLDAASCGGGVWCESTDAVVSNCVVTGNSAAYEGGGACSGTVNNCTLNGNSAQSGGGAAYSMLNNCILNGNSASAFGGGAYSGTLNNCTLSGNTAGSGGGGASSGTLNNCTLSGNLAYSGGGAAYATLNNCTLVGNSASAYCGGAFAGALTNCILYYNSAPTNSNFNDSTPERGPGGIIILPGLPSSPVRTLSYCCTTPLPTNGVGNFTNAPLFADQAGGDLRLQVNSPCINSGLNAYSSGATDLDGNPRIRGGTVDVGAYEYQNPASLIAYAWLQRYGLPTDGSADLTDADGDGLNNWQEWVAGTDPTNAASVLKLSQPSLTGPNVTLTWNSVTNRTYSVQRATDLGAATPFLLLQTNLAGLSGTTSYTDTNTPAPGPAYYRVGVQ
jgi:hypothetical protein